jgi:hypothetical protein
MGFAFGFLVRFYPITYIDAIDVCNFIFLKKSSLYFLIQICLKMPLKVSELLQVEMPVKWNAAGTEGTERFLTIVINKKCPIFNIMIKIGHL